MAGADRHDGVGEVRLERAAIGEIGVEAGAGLRDHVRGLGDRANEPENRGAAQPLAVIFVGPRGPTERAKLAAEAPHDPRPQPLLELFSPRL